MYKRQAVERTRVGLGSTDRQRRWDPDGMLIPVSSWRRNLLRRNEHIDETVILECSSPRSKVCSVVVARFDE